MNGVFRVLFFVVVTAVVLATAGMICRADDGSAAPEAKTPADVPAAKPKPELSPALAALRDRVRRTVAAHQKQPFNTRDNSATEIMDFCWAFGCGTEVTLEGAASRRINGITCLCWNYPCAGFEMLGRSQGRVAPRIGYGCQEQPGEFLAMLAASRVPPEYPVRVGQDVRSVADLVVAEQRSCRSGSDLSLKLMGLSHYVVEAEWKNDLGDTWSIERIVREELERPMTAGSEQGTNRLMGLSYAVARRVRQQQPIDGQYQRAQKYLDDFQTFAFRLQNSDGSWGPHFLAARSSNADPAIQLRSTGRVLEWLVVSLPEKRLDEPGVVNAVECVVRLLDTQRYQWNMPAMSTREIAAAGHALHALADYDERVFKPADPGKEEAATAERKAETPKAR